MITLALAAITLIVLTPSCSKYAEGSKFTLLTKKARLTGEWVIESVTYNGTDQTSIYTTAVGANYVLEIEKDGGYRTEGLSPDTGKWELGEDKDDIFITSDQVGSTQVTFRIVRLASKELWLKQTQTNGDIIQINYKAK